MVIHVGDKYAGTQYAIFELKASQAHDKTVEERTDGKTRDFIKYCNIPGKYVSTRNVFKYKGYIKEERAERKKSRKRSSHVKTDPNKTGRERLKHNEKKNKNTNVKGGVR